MLLTSQEDPSSYFNGDENYLHYHPRLPLPPLPPGALIEQPPPAEGNVPRQSPLLFICDAASICAGDLAANVLGNNISKQNYAGFDSLSVSLGGCVTALLCSCCDSSQSSQQGFSWRIQSSRDV